VTYFAHARTAFKYGLIALGFKPGDRLLIPDYVCDALLQPVRQLALEPVYFPVNDSFEPQWEVLDSIARKTACRAIVMVHYFGQPQDVERHRAFCAAHGLFLLEDNAHGFGGEINGRLLGTLGDMGISSPRKILNAISGGILYINGEEQPPPSLPSCHMGRGERLLRRGFERWPKLKVRALVLAGRLPNFSDPSAFHEPTVHDQVADANSTRVISNSVASLSLQETARQRRERWIAWHGLAQHIGLRPVYAGVHPGSSPWAFPAYIESSEQRDRILMRGLKKGVVFFPWPALPADILQLQGRPVKRWRGLVCAPLHQEPPELL